MGYLNSRLPQLDNSKSLLRFMFACQKQAFGSTILEQFGYDILQRNIALLLAEYSAEDIARGIVIAAHHSDYPFSTAFIKDRIEWLRDLKTQAATVAPGRVYVPNKS